MTEVCGLSDGCAPVGTGSGISRGVVGTLALGAGISGASCSVVIDGSIGSGSGGSVGSGDPGGELTGGLLVGYS